LKVLITGGLGFIGQHLDNRLINAGHSVAVVDNCLEQVHTSRNWSSTRTRVGDVRDRGTLAELVSGLDAVVHLAAETGVGQSMYEIAQHVSVNALGTATVLETLAAANFKGNFVLTSSRAVYGEGRYECATCGAVTPAPRQGPTSLGWDPPCPTCAGAIEAIPTDERAPHSPVSVYGATKSSQEHLVTIAADAYGFDYTVLRLFNVYGPGQSLANPYTGVLSTFYQRLIRGLAVNVYEDGLESRDFVYVDDVVTALQSAVEGRLRNVIVNVGSGESTSLLGLATKLRDLTCSTSEIVVSGDYRRGDIRHAIADTRLLACLDATGAPTPLDMGLPRWLSWAREEPPVPDLTPDADRHLRARGLLG
jgi:dTDP-L-rhamnose 4-epimerase